MAATLNKDYHNKFIYYTVPEGSLIKCKILDNQGNVINGRCVDISLGGIGVICDDYINEGNEVNIEIDLEMLTDGEFAKQCTFKAKVISHQDLKSEPLTGFGFHLSRESFFDLRKVNNYLTSKISTEEMYNMLGEAGVNIDDVLS